MRYPSLCAFAVGLAVMAGTLAGCGGDDSTGEGGPTFSSTEFGRTLFGFDYAEHPAAPAGGTLFSVWSKVPDAAPSSYPWTRGNMDVYVLYGQGWHLRCLTGNLIVASSSEASFNANSMLFTEPEGTWIDEFSYYQSSPEYTQAQVMGWVWAAWQVVVAPSGFTIRQWLKFGLDGPVFAAGESQVTVAELRNTLVTQRGWTQTQANAWTPGDATRFQVGKDRGFLVHARMMATSQVPSLETLDAYARASAGDSSAWADYRLSWENGVPDLHDRSGHGRDLTIADGGVLYQGPASPGF